MSRSADLAALREGDVEGDRVVWASKTWRSVGLSSVAAAFGVGKTGMSASLLRAAVLEVGVSMDRF